MATKKPEWKPWTKLKDVDVEEFMKWGVGDSDEDVEENLLEKKPKSTNSNEETEVAGIKPNLKKKDVTKKMQKPPIKKLKKDEAVEHKETLKQLEETDPQFYKFLRTHDKGLLEFELSDDSSGDEKFHKPKAGDLEEQEVLSDASDGDDKTTEPKFFKDVRIVTAGMVDEWTQQLQTDQPPLHLLMEIVKAFNAASIYIQGGPKGSYFVVRSSTVFNGIVRLCILDMSSALDKVGKNKQADTINPKNWPKLKACLKMYLTDLNKMLGAVTDTEIVRVLLKHVVAMMVYVTEFPKLAKEFFKKLVNFWGSGEESIRVLAVLCLANIVRRLPQHLENSLKMLYLSYVKNCKFTSPTTWPLINFMKRSLVEIFLLDKSAAYQHAFIYIRQLAIHLRNAVTISKKEMMKAVYNWQYVHCLAFWAQLVGTSYPNQTLEPLIYPLVQLVMGTVRLNASAKYYPLRFHCVRILIQLSKETNTFIPVLPLLTDVLENTDFNKRHTRAGWKSLDFLCMLKLSKTQLVEQGFRDGVISNVYELFMDYLNVEAHTVGFPELVLPTVVQLKVFLKKCKVINFTKQMKRILEKIEENSCTVCERRKAINFSLGDVKAVEAWEIQNRQKGTPLSNYYSNYRKIRDRELAEESTNNQKERLEDTRMPQIMRKELMDKKKMRERKVDLPEPKKVEKASAGPRDEEPNDDQDEDELRSDEEFDKELNNLGNEADDETEDEDSESN